MPEKITTIDRLRELASRDDGVYCFINLDNGLISRKHIRHWDEDDEWYVHHLIDESEEEGDESILSKSNIANAIETGNFYSEDED